MGPVMSTKNNHHPNAIDIEPYNITNNITNNDNDNGLECSNIWLPDGTWFHIFSYMNAPVHILGGQGSFYGVSEFFRKIAFASKPFFSTALRYLKHTPLTIEHHYFLKAGLLKRIAWAAEHGVQLGGIAIYINSETACSIYKFLLMSCDIRRMTVCHVRDDWMDLDVERDAAVEAGIPCSAFHTATTKTKTPGNYKIEFQKFFADYVPTRAKSLTQMSIHMKKGEWHLPVLTNFSNSLEELTLCISPDHEQDADLQDLSKSIQQLSKLKKLKLSFLWKRCSFEIESKTIEKIDMTGSEEGCFLDKCICPSLKVFKCNYKRSNDAEQEQSNGLRPRFPFSDNILEKLESCKRNRKGVHVTVGECSFVGMIVVPETCKVMFTSQ